MASVGLVISEDPSLVHGPSLHAPLSQGCGRHPIGAHRANKLCRSRHSSSLPGQMMQRSCWFMCGSTLAAFAIR